MFDQPTSLFMLGCVARLGLAAIFSLAALHAVRDWPLHAETIVQYRLAPRGLSLSLAGILPILQLSAASLLLAWPAAGAVLSVALLALFAAAIAINVARGRTDIACGCGGADGQRLSMGLVLRNVALMLLVAPAGFTPATGHIDGPICVGVAGSLAVFVATYFTANQLLTNAQNFRRRQA